MPLYSDSHLYLPHFQHVLLDPVYFSPALQCFGISSYYVHTFSRLTASYHSDFSLNVTCPESLSLTSNLEQATSPSHQSVWSLHSIPFDILFVNLLQFPLCQLECKLLESRILVCLIILDVQKSAWLTVGVQNNPKGTSLFIFYSVTINSFSLSECYSLWFFIWRWPFQINLTTFHHWVNILNLYIIF